MWRFWLLQVFSPQLPGVLHFLGLVGFPQELNETAAAETVQSAQEFGGNVNWLYPIIIP